MRRAIGRVIRGCGYVEGYGSHPGTGMLVMFVLMGAAAGLRAGWERGAIGAGLMLAVFGPMYLYGAWDRGRLGERRKRQDV